MSWTNIQKQSEAARKRDERTARKRQKELEQILREYSKRTAQEQAKLEVEAFENSIEVLLSVHKEASPRFDWLAPLAALPPHAPNIPDPAAHEKQLVECEQMRALARRVLAGDENAYGEALRQVSAFGELSTLGSSIAFRVHNPQIIVCELKVNGRDSIPAEVKSLTSAGKVSVKTMPKSRFYEVYQDYICGCVLRVAREVLALLPVDAAVVTALVSTVQASTGTDVETPVLSVAIRREGLDRFDFARLDPSDALENFPHRGDVLASRKSGEFAGIIPIKPEDVSVAEPAKLSLGDLLHRARGLRADISAKLKAREANQQAELQASPTPT